jgi:hypothetical protein
MSYNSIIAEDELRKLSTVLLQIESELLAKYNIKTHIYLSFDSDRGVVITGENGEDFDSIKLDKEMLTIVKIRSVVEYYYLETLRKVLTDEINGVLKRVSINGLKEVHNNLFGE